MAPRPIRARGYVSFKKDEDKDTNGNGNGNTSNKPVVGPQKEKSERKKYMSERPIRKELSKSIRQIKKDPLLKHAKVDPTITGGKEQLYSSYLQDELWKMRFGDDANIPKAGEKRKLKKSFRKEGLSRKEARQKATTQMEETYGKLKGESKELGYPLFYKDWKGSEFETGEGTRKDFRKWLKSKKGGGYIGRAIKTYQDSGKVENGDDLLKDYNEKGWVWNPTDYNAYGNWRNYQQQWANDLYRTKQITEDQWQNMDFSRERYNKVIIAQIEADLLKDFKVTKKGDWKYTGK